MNKSSEQINDCMNSWVETKAHCIGDVLSRLLLFLKSTGFMSEDQLKELLKGYLDE